VVLVIGGLAANALAQLVRGAAAKAGFTNPGVLAAVTRVAVWSFAVVVAITQLGIATTLINALVIGVIGGLSLAFGLAFGLGGRDRAARMLETVGRNLDQARPRLERAAQAVREESRPGDDVSMAVPHHSHTGISEAGWVERSQADRRRVSRPGLRDRRAGNGSS